MSIEIDTTEFNSILQNRKINEIFKSHDLFRAGGYIAISRITHLFPVKITYKDNKIYGQAENIFDYGTSDKIIGIIRKILFEGTILKQLSQKITIVHGMVWDDIYIGDDLVYDNRDCIEMNFAPFNSQILKNLLSEIAKLFGFSIQIEPKLATVHYKLPRMGIPKDVMVYNADVITFTVVDL